MKLSSVRTVASATPAPRPGVLRSSALLSGALAMTLTACQAAPGGTAGSDSQGRQGAASTPTYPPVVITASVAKGATDVRPDAKVTVSAKQGTLHTVTVKDPKGKELRGEIANGSWRLLDVLSPGTTYTLAATGQAEGGAPGTLSQKFTTLTPKVEATYRVTPDETTVGVGMPVMVTFDSSVQTPEMRANVEKRMKITTIPAQEGSWGWAANNQLQWRPKTYWKPGTKVTVNAPLRGVQTGKEKWVTQDKGAAFTISKTARISTVDVAGHSMTVRENGKVVGTYPVSSGKPMGTYRTRSGTKIITEKLPFMVMDAATLGVPKDDPNYYRTEVNWAMRVTNTGEFLHSAPWSVWAQGRRNVSHGCVNMSPGAARAMFRDSLVGDVVDFINSPRRMKPGDGVGVWLYTYPEWQQLSALSKAAATKDAKTPTDSAKASGGKSDSDSTSTSRSSASPSHAA